MVHAKHSSRPRAYLVAFFGALLAVAFGMTLQPNDAIAQVKSSSSRTNTATREPKSLSPKMARPVSNPFPILHRDLLNLGEGQKGLQRQLQSLTEATRRHSHDLERRTDTLTNQLNRLATQQQQSAAMQQVLAATIRSTRLLLMINLGLLLVLCGALLFFAYQVKQFGGFQLKGQKQIGAATSDAPDGAFEHQWKVGS